MLLIALGTPGDKKIISYSKISSSIPFLQKAIFRSDKVLAFVSEISKFPSNILTSATLSTRYLAPDRPVFPHPIIATFLSFNVSI